VLTVGVIVVGAAFALFFDRAFELSHEIVFAPGTYMFRPAKREKLVQLFPDQFWSETERGDCCSPCSFWAVADGQGRGATWERVPSGRWPGAPVTGGATVSA